MSVAEKRLFSMVNGGGRARYEIEIAGLRARLYLHSIRWECAQSLWASDDNRKLVLTTGYQFNNKIRDIVTIYGVTSIEVLRENRDGVVFVITNEVNKEQHQHMIYVECKYEPIVDDALEAELDPSESTLCVELL